MPKSVKIKPVDDLQPVRIGAAAPKKGVPFAELKIAVLVPCYNEELTIGAVVTRFRAVLPAATIYVYDNNSLDMTAIVARAHGAIVVREPRQGKGNVVRRMFSDIDADVYVMADGDGTYAPEDALTLIDRLVTNRCDMVVGTRNGVTRDAGRKGHGFGNKMFNRIYHGLFGRDFTDIFSGYRVFTR
ncbi:MAG: glycosyltransferase, partial [Phyllobacteriaceae bacterium]|nr:glycosyltransferase [Phyllobacteriaceae bacterium]